MLYVRALRTNLPFQEMRHDSNRSQLERISAGFVAPRKINHTRFSSIAAPTTSFSREVTSEYGQVFHVANGPPGWLVCGEILMLRVLATSSGWHSRWKGNRHTQLLKVPWSSSKSRKNISKRKCLPKSVLSRFLLSRLILGFRSLLS